MEKQSYLLKQCLAEADSVISRSYLLDICNKDIIPSELSLADCYNLRLLKLKMLVYNPEENINDKLMTIYSALLDAVENVNVGLIVRSYASGEVDFIFAIYAADETGSAAKLLQGGILGNFPGSELKNYSRTVTRSMMKATRLMTTATRLMRKFQRTFRRTCLMMKFRRMFPKI